MYHFARIPSLILFFMIFYRILPVLGIDNRNINEWSGKLSNGTSISREGLDAKLLDHSNWLTKRVGKKLNLKDAKLNGVNPKNKDLREV